MKLFKKSKPAEESGERQEHDERVEQAADMRANRDAQPHGEEQAEKGKRPRKLGGLKGALIRCGAALLVAAILLVITGFSIFDLIKGPEKVVSIDDAEPGSFVSCELAALFGTYGEQPNDYSYSVVPIGTKMVTVRFTKRYFDSAQSLLDETNKYVDGSIPYLDKYAVVQGTVEEISEEQSKGLYDWFAANKEDMVNRAMIVDTGDATDYLSDKMLTVDTVNGKSQNIVFVLTGISALLILCAIAELVLMAFGFYKAETPSSGGEAEQLLAEREANAQTSEAPKEGAAGTEEKASESTEDKE